MLMKKILSMLAVMLAVTFCSVTFSSCSSDDDNNTEVLLNKILGSWADIDKTEDEYVSSETAIIYTFNANKTCSQYFYFAVNGKKLRENTANYAFDYDGKNIILYHNRDRNDRSPLHYTLTVYGNKMILGNQEDGFFNLVRQ